MHVRYIAHPETQAQAGDVKDILEELKITDDAKDGMIEVWNKTDLLSEGDLLNAMNTSNRHDKVQAVSAITGHGVNDLLDEIEVCLRETTMDEIVRLAFSEGNRRAWLYKQGVVTSEDTKDNMLEISVTWTPKLQAQFKKV